MANESAAATMGSQSRNILPSISLPSLMTSPLLLPCVSTLLLAALLWGIVSWWFGTKQTLAIANVPPGPRPWPIVGNLPSLGHQPHRALADLAHNHGDCMSLRLGSKLTVVVSSLDAAQEVLGSKASIFVRRLAPLPMAVDLLLAGGNHGKTRSIPGMAYSLIEPKLRKLVHTHLLSQSNIAGTAPLREAESRFLCKAVKAEVEANTDDLQRGSRSSELLLSEGRVEGLRSHVKRAVLNMWLLLAFGSRIMGENEQGWSEDGENGKRSWRESLQKVAGGAADQGEVTPAQRELFRQYVLRDFETTEGEIVTALNAFNLADHVLQLRGFCGVLITKCRRLASQRDNVLEVLVEGARVDLTKRLSKGTSSQAEERGSSSRSKGEEEEQWEMVGSGTGPSEEQSAQRSSKRPPLPPSKAGKPSPSTAPAPSLPKPACFAEILLSLEGPEKLTDPGICALLYDLIHSAVGPIAAAVEWTMAELVKNPKMQADLRSSLESAVGMSAPFREADLERTPFLQAVVLESLRLHPPVPLLRPRMASKDCKLGEFDIPEGANVLINAWSISRDPRWWTTSWDFDPSRFIQGDVPPWKRLSEFKLLPFGKTSAESGCPASLLASKVVGVLVAELVRGFSWSALDSSPARLEKMMEEGSGVEVMEMRKPLVAKVLVRE